MGTFKYRRLYIAVYTDLVCKRDTIMVSTAVSTSPYMIYADFVCKRDRHATDLTYSTDRVNINP